MFSAVLFKVNEATKVLHKVKGHPYWPAVITSIDESRIVLRYFGTCETNVVKHKSFLANLTSNNVRKLCGKNKRKDLAQALEEAELFVSN